MPMTDENATTPASIFLDIQHKVENGHEYQAADTRIDFQRLFTALRASISHNESLKAQVASAEALLTEKDIEIFGKDLEIFNALAQFDQLKDQK